MNIIGFHLTFLSSIHIQIQVTFFAPTYLFIISRASTKSLDTK